MMSPSTPISTKIWLWVLIKLHSTSKLSICRRQLLPYGGGHPFSGIIFFLFEISMAVDRLTIYCRQLFFHKDYTERQYFVIIRGRKCQFFNKKNQIFRRLFKVALCILQHRSDQLLSAALQREKNVHRVILICGVECAYADCTYIGDNVTKQ